jgi:hypothetical protein
MLLQKEGADEFMIGATLGVMSENVALLERV